jgi:hypothetical protein
MIIRQNTQLDFMFCRMTLFRVVFDLDFSDWAVAGYDAKTSMRAAMSNSSV